MTTQVANPTTTGVTVSAPPRGPLGPRPAATLYSTADGKVGVTSAGVQQPNNAAVTTTATTTSTVAVPVTQQANGNPALSSSPLSPGIMTGRPTFQRDDAHHASLFIGDLGPEVDDAALRSAFDRFPTLSECRVMFDPNTGRSRGYGFASFADQEDAQRALTTLNGEWLGTRPLRINWANQKTRHHRSATHDAAGQPLTLEQISAAAPAHNTTVYVGNLHPTTTQNDIVNLFAGLGFVREVRLQAERGYGFAVLETHDIAATAIHTLTSNGTQLHGRVLRFNWGKDRNEGVHTHAGIGGGLAAVPNIFGNLVYTGFPQQPLAYGAGFALPTTGFGPQAAVTGAAPGQAGATASALNGVFAPSAAYATAPATPAHPSTIAINPAYVQAVQQQHQQQQAAAAAAAAAAGAQPGSAATTATGAPLGLNMSYVHQHGGQLHPSTALSQQGHLMTPAPTTPGGSTVYGNGAVMAAGVQMG